MLKFTSSDLQISGSQGPHRAATYEDVFDDTCSADGSEAIFVNNQPRVMNTEQISIGAGLSLDIISNGNE